MIISVFRWHIGLSRRTKHFVALSDGPVPRNPPIISVGRFINVKHEAYKKPVCCVGIDGQDVHRDNVDRVPERPSKNDPHLPDRAARTGASLDQ